MIRQITLSFSICTALLFVSVSSQATQAAFQPGQDRQCGISNFQQDLIALVQQARAQNRNCGGQFFRATTPLQWNDRLASAAAGHSADMANRNYFSHQSQDGSAFSDRIARQGYRWSTIGENISAGRRTVGEVMNAWLQSPHHCANIMNPHFSEIGVACVLNKSSTYDYYWSMELGHP